jgi:DNA-binding transcriptional ArsR family regulator/uncharacterized protein YndB with AHSA1/START domain
LEPVWKALSDPRRRRVLDLLREGPMTTGAIASEFDISRYGVMKHLRVLTDAGLVVVRRQGRECWNHLNAVPLRRVYDRWVTRFEDRMAVSLLDFQRYVAQTTTPMGGRTHPSATLEEETVGISGKTRRLDLGWVEIELEVEVGAPPEEAYRAFVDDIGRWWGRDWIMGGDNTTAMVLEDVPGGRLLEQWGPRDGAIWAQVIRVARGRLLHMGIPEGVFWSGPGQFTVRFVPADNGTLVQLSHGCTQVYADDAHAGIVQGWTALVMERYADYVAGKPVANSVIGPMAEPGRQME